MKIIRTKIFGNPENKRQLQKFIRDIGVDYINKYPNSMLVQQARIDKVTKGLGNKPIDEVVIVGKRLLREYKDLTRYPTPKFFKRINNNTTITGIINK